MALLAVPYVAVHLLLNQTCRLSEKAAQAVAQRRAGVSARRRGVSATGLAATQSCDPGPLGKLPRAIISIAINSTFGLTP